MKCAFFTVAIACVLCIGYVFASDDCSGFVKSYLKKKLEVAESGQVECAQKLELPQYMCGGDPDRAKVTFPKYVEFMKSKSSDEKKKVKDCFAQIGSKVMSQLNIPDQCKEEFNEKVGEIKKKYYVHLN